MAQLSLSFLGPFQVMRAGELVTGFASNRIRALLAYLAIEVGHRHPRELLAGLLWPDWPDRAALSNLRHALASLRQTIGDREAQPPFLLISREAIQFNAASDYDLDILSFTELCAAGKAGQPDVDRLQQAVALYRGPFMEGFSLGDSAAFEQWAALRREQLVQQLLEALQGLVAHHEERGEYEQAQRYCRRQLDLDPTREEAHRQLMRAMTRGGQRSTALAQYLICRRLLAEELGVEPAEETSALYQAIRQGTLFGVAPTVVGATPPSDKLSMPLGPPLAPTFGEVGTLPEVEEGPPEAPQPLFVAREKELAQLGRWLGMALSGQGRAGFVVGEPGSGKTLLVQEFALRAMEEHPELVMAWGRCNAYSGLGDPYLPFLEILGMLTADVEGQRAAGGIAREHARRLGGIFPTMVGTLLDAAPGLIDLLIPSAGLLARAQVLAPQGAPWRTRLEDALPHRAASGAGPRSASQVDLFQQVTRVLQAVAKTHPLLLVLDDLQWADAGSIALLFHLGRRLVGSRILVVGMYRPEEVAQGRGGEPHPLEQVLYEFERTWGESQVDLAQAEGRCFVEALVDSEPNRLATGFREALYRHTGGQALFTVELWRGLQERGDLVRDEGGYWVEGHHLNWEQLPRRVEAAIGAHIARLPREWQELLTVASVEGEEFTAEVVARVQAGSDRRGPGLYEVLRALGGGLSAEQHLVRTTSLRRVGEGRPANGLSPASLGQGQSGIGQRLSQYKFRHYLFQQYLYQRLDEAERAHLHEQVGLALERLYGATPRALTLEVDEGQWWTWAWMKLASPQRFEVAAIAPQLARHFHLAGLTQRAVIYLRQALERAWILSAYEEGIAHTRRALELLVTLPPTPTRIRYECILQTDLSTVLATGRSYILPEVGRARTRAYELAQQLDDAPLLCVALANLAHYHRQCGELRLARELGERAVHLAEGQEEPWATSAHIALAQTLIICGEFSSACMHLAPQIAAYLEPQPHLAGVRDLTNRLHLVRTPWALWCLGYPEQALKVGRAALAVAYAAEDEFNITQVLYLGICFLHQLRREVGAVEQALRELCALANKESCAPVLRPFATLYRGCVHMQSGLLEQGVGELRRGLEEWSAGCGIHQPHWRGYLAQALARAGRVEEGLDVLAEALEQVERTGERFNEAELHRLKGELLLRKGWADSSRLTEPEAEACFQKAIAVARGQEARSWELRATVSLARLWQRQGRREEAHQMLSAIYGWFTEGFGTPDLQEARALLEHLSIDRAGQVAV